MSPMIRYAKGGSEYTVWTDYPENCERILRECGFEILPPHAPLPDPPKDGMTIIQDGQIRFEDDGYKYGDGVVLVADEKGVSVDSLYDGGYHNGEVHVSWATLDAVRKLLTGGP